MKLQNKTKSTVGKWILQKVNTPAWRAGNITGYKHYNHYRGDEERNFKFKNKKYTRIVSFVNFSE